MRSLLIAACLAAGALATAASAQTLMKSPPTKPVARKAPSVARPPSTNLVMPPANDDCSAPTSIAGPGPHAFDTLTATTGAQGQNEALCLAFGTTGIGNDVWFTWQASVTANTELTLCIGATTDTKVAVYAGAGCPVGSAIACNDDTCGLQSRLTFAATAGATYTIQVGTYPGAPGTNGTFQINALTGPANDSCASPSAIAGNGPFAFDTSSAATGAQGQSNAACLFFGTTGIGNDVWFTWTSNITGPALVSFCNGASNDTKVAVYAGAGCPGGAALACNDDTCDLQSNFVFNAFAGNTYTIQVGCYPGTSGGAGTFSIGIPSAHDECSAPIAINGNGPHAFDLSSASTGTQGQNNANCLFFGETGINTDVWYSWPATCSGTVTVSLCSGASLDSKLAVYDASSCPANAALACDDDLCSPAGPSEVQFPALAGHTYLLQVGIFPEGTPGSGTFAMTCGGGGPPGTPFCLADGTGGLIACPCGNGGLPGRGCDNSFGTGGADLALSGTINPDTIVMTTNGETPTALSIFLQGSGNVASGVVFGDGVRCTAGVLKRLYVKSASGGSASAPNFGSGDPSITSQSSILGDTIAPGTSRYYQVYYRDANATFCPNPPGNTWNISGGQIIQW